MCVKISIKLVFPLNTVYLYTVSNLHINVFLLGQHVEKKNCHNGSNKWPDFHNNISYFIRQLINNEFSYSIVMSPKCVINMLLVLVSSTVDIYEMMSCFITGSHI